MSISRRLRSRLLHAAQQWVGTAKANRQHEDLHGTAEYRRQAERELIEANQDAQELGDLLRSLPE